MCPPDLHRQLGGLAFELPPLPAFSLVEDDVAGDVDAFLHRIIEPVRLAPGLVSEHHHRMRAVVKLLDTGARLLGIGLAAEYAQEVDARLGAMPALVRCDAVQAFRRRSVEDEDCCE